MRQVTSSRMHYPFLFLSCFYFSLYIHLFTLQDLFVNNCQVYTAWAIKQKMTSTKGISGNLI